MITTKVGSKRPSNGSNLTIITPEAKKPHRKPQFTSSIYHQTKLTKLTNLSSKGVLSHSSLAAMALSMAC